MMRSGFLTVVSVACSAMIAPSHAIADDKDAEHLANQIFDVFSETTPQDCYELRDVAKRTELNPSNPVNVTFGYGGEVFRLAEEGLRLICTSMSLSKSISRLEKEPTRLRNEADRLEGLWQDAHRKNPEKFPDFPGRDKSQKRLLADAEDIESDLKIMRHDVEGIYFSAIRILKLADRQANKDILLRRVSNVEADANHELLKRLVGAGGGNISAALGRSNSLL